MISKSKAASALVLNLTTVIVTTIVMLSYFLGNKDIFIHSLPQSFQFFTTDSNILSMIASLIIIPFEILVLTGKSETLPQFAITLKYIGTASVMLTFFTVMLFLGPLFGYSVFLANMGIFTHLISPLLAFYSFAVLETCCKISLRDVLIAMIPTVIYGIVYLNLAILIGEKNGGWIDFYYFNIGGYWYISAVIMFCAGLLINLLLKILHNSSYNKSRALSASAFV